MPGSSTTPGRPSACVGALGHIAFRYTDSVGTRDPFSIAAQWLACTFPCRRFADILAVACARLGADVVRYTFIVVDLHHLLLAGLPAHLRENSRSVRRRATKDPRADRSAFFARDEGKTAAGSRRTIAASGREASASHGVTSELLHRVSWERPLRIVRVDLASDTSRLVPYPSATTG